MRDHKITSEVGKNINDLKEISTKMKKCVSVTDL